ncbi:uncharacterized protein [Coffea arabica]|uniref:Uncharacterized protein isoform X4 n=1 Tax=Coffea arabica TaxID=13443 RepID=A0ABM4WCG3_COFAR
MCLLLRCLPRCLSAAQGPYSQTSANSRFQWSRSAAARSLLFLLLRCQGVAVFYLFPHPERRPSVFSLEPRYRSNFDSNDWSTQLART